MQDITCLKIDTHTCQLMVKFITTDEILTQDKQNMLVCPGSNGRWYMSTLNIPKINLA